MNNQNNRYFPYFQKFESKFLNDDNFLLECSKAIQLSEKSTMEELAHYKKLAVDSLIKINNLNNQLEKMEYQIMTLCSQIKQTKKHLE
jgi:hypothetical protein